MAAVNCNPAQVIRARNGFIYSVADGGSGTFPGDKAEQIERAGSFFDQMAEEGYWSETFYIHYAYQWTSLNDLDEGPDVDA